MNYLLAVNLDTWSQTGLDVTRLVAAGMNYLQAVTPRLALGGEAFYLGLQRKCGIGLAGEICSSANHCGQLG